MALYSNESLSYLRGKIDLIEVISANVQLKRQGSTYKALCPFHEEKTPSFQVQVGQEHYHCFGCGAHGDAIAFLMNHLKMSFVDAIEWLAQHFGVMLEKKEGEKQKESINRQGLKEALELACNFYHTILLHTEEGHQALAYLYHRGMDLEFIRHFRIGYAPSLRTGLFHFAKGEKIEEEILLAAGLITEKKRDFFSDRITFPILDAFGSVIGFSARKYKEEVFGGKYINTSETPLFKKSHVLFGLSYSRKRIAKEKKVLLVEGQIDALQLIYGGWDFVVAAQGTAFGEGHVKLLLDLGVNKVFLAMDGDEAGRTASMKIGHLFQKKGICVFVMKLPEKSDPDSFIQTEGIEAFSMLLEGSSDYLSFLVSYYSKDVDFSNPAQKNACVQKLIEQVRLWEEPLLVYESLRKIAQLTKVPEAFMGVGAKPSHSIVKRVGRAGRAVVDPDRVLEVDVIRWVLLCHHSKVYEMVRANLTQEFFRNAVCRKIFTYLMQKEVCKDLMAISSLLEDSQEQDILSEIVQKKINLEKFDEGVTEAIERLIMRQWREELMAIEQKISNSKEEEALQLAKVFDQVKNKQPKVLSL